MINGFLKKSQIRHKLILLNLLITGIVFLIAAVILFMTEYIFFKDSLLQELTIQAKIVASNSTASLAFNDHKAAGETLSALKTSPNIECAVIYARNGTVFATYRRPDINKKTTPVPPPKDGHYFDHKELSIVQGIALDRDRIGTIYIRSDLKKLYFLMIQNGVVAFITLLLVFMVAYLLMSRWNRVIIEPIMNLFHVMKLVTWEKNYTLKAHVYGEDEIGSLAQGFNEMLEQIRQRDTKLLTEIAERREAEEHLRESEKRFKTIFDNNTDGLLVADIESRKFVLANPMICSMLGYEDEEFIKMSITDVHPYEDLPYVVEQFEKQARGEMTVAEKLPVKRKDGTVFYADVNTSQLSLEGKDYILGAFRDVTDRERAKDALLDSEQKLKAIVYGSPIPQFVIDYDHTVIYWNDALAELTGIKAEEMIGTKDQWRAFYAAERSCMADLLLEGAIEKGMEMYHGKYKKSSLVANAYEVMDFFPTLGNDGKWLHFTAAEIKDARGKVIGVVETLEDVTERKLAEESVRRLNEELERKVEERTSQLLDAREELVRKEKLAVLGQFSGSVGHELRNPLGVMNNAVYFLKTVMAGADDTLMEYLDIIKHEIDNSQRIISGLLDFARTKTPQKMTVTVGELMEESLARCTLPENVGIQSNIPDTLPPLNVDPLQMGQVCQNLISNAIQSMPEGGRLRISARQVQGSRFKVQGSEEKNVEHETLNIEPDTDFIEISVADTGVGISPENMKKLFHPLFTTKTKGVGFGLTVCRNLTEANGGRIDVESELGKGTRFIILLPMEG